MANKHEGCQKPFEEHPSRDAEEEPSLSRYERLAVVGCGAVTQQYYVPALKQVSSCKVDWFVDVNSSNARRAAEEYGGGSTANDYNAVISKVDAAIVAVPNHLHSKISADFLRAGRGVLCEKPIANTSQSAAEMIDASRRFGARLAINFFKRRFGSYRTVKALLGQSLGRIRRIDCKEGGTLSWPFSSSYLLQKDKSGGGVLIDRGSHKLDILSWLFGSDWELVSYRDDSLGRIESNCEVDFVVKWNRDRIPCHIELSYARKLGRKMVIQGDSSWLVIDESDTNQIHVKTEDQDLSIRSGSPRSHVSYFAGQIESFIRGAPDDCLANGEDATKNLIFIEHCYRRAQDLPYPWERPQVLKWGWSISSQYKRLLVAGASGFLGTRLAEKLALDLNMSVRATFHRPERATRLARLPVELVECDLLSKDQATRAVQGCDAIVNCAIGRPDTFGDTGTAMEVFTSGTRNLLEAAKAEGVKKFIHISTAAVHGFRQNSSIADESHRFKHRLSRSWYEKGKISQEKLVMKFAEHVPSVVLRPTLIYGPYSEPWAINIMERLTHGRPSLVDKKGIANLVYVDDVVDAVLLAIEDERADGGVFIINNDQETVAWKDYVSKFASFTQNSPNVLPAGHLSALRFRKLLSLCADSAVACRDSLGSRELLTLLARIPLAAVLGSRFVRGATRKRIEQHMSTIDESPVSDMGALLAKYETMSNVLYDNLTCHTMFSSALAKSTLGWVPRTTCAEGTRNIIEWAKWVGLGPTEAQTIRSKNSY
jgi:nucleoside-diphosphate-sugar epimerase/predicted dehydrogenase